MMLSLIGPRMGKACVEMYPSFYDGAFWDGMVASSKGNKLVAIVYSY